MTSMFSSKHGGMRLTSSIMMQEIIPKLYNFKQILTVLILNGSIEVQKWPFREGMYL
jgi:hypothetical protein